MPPAAGCDRSAKLRRPVTVRCDAAEGGTGPRGGCSPDSPLLLEGGAEFFMLKSHRVDYNRDPKRGI